ncbi:MAG: mechanosensitive ion channel family protein [Oscillospiraceae bacterium]|nr:mechanosensitive ion channel family protein [Oscillospiraceae bacterium]
MNTLSFWSSFSQSALTFLPKFLEAAIVFAVGWWLSSLVRRLCKKALQRADRGTAVASFLSSAASVAIRVLAGIMALSSLGLNTSVIVGALSALGLGVSLAMKDNMANVACGLQMLFTKPFHAGDYIAAEGVEGTVERMELMFTTLRTYENKEVVFPNARLCSSIVTNYTAMEKRRVDLEFGISYDDDLKGAKELLRQVATNDKRVLPEPAPLVAVSKHGDSALLLTMHLWCKTEQYWDVYYAMQEKVKLAFDENDYHIPFPQVDVHTQPDVPVKLAKADAAGKD